MYQAFIEKKKKKTPAEINLGKTTSTKVNGDTIIDSVTQLYLVQCRH